ncbi:DUF2917 domain-containing protein [Roseateles sp.]|uniref:DUF2917 domain-containing protein n=1 Tax=Roseateles sp. TaxID=1971397 RepID=UPI0032667002
MKDRFTTQLSAGQALTLAAVRGPRRLVVISGRLWLTVSGGVDDHWLCAGEGLTLAAGHEAVVEAWPEAAFQVLQPVAQRRTARADAGRRLALAGA